MSRPRCSACFSRVKAVDHRGYCRRCRREREELIPDLAERTRPAPAELREIEGRLGLVRAAKRERCGAELSLDELDRVVPPVWCARTRQRQGKAVACGRDA